MSIIIETSYIQLTLECSECGHQWDSENRDAMSIRVAEMDAEDETCPHCIENE